MAEPDQIDRLVGQWRDVRSDLDGDTMATVARLLLVGELIARRIEEHGAEHGLRRAEGDVLLALRRAGAPHRLSPSRLAGSLLVSSGTMTARLDRLEARGLIRRVPNPQDRRGMDVELTDAGVELVDEVVAEHVRREQEMLSPLSARERAQLQAITRKLLDHLQGG